MDSPHMHVLTVNTVFAIASLDLPLRKLSPPPFREQALLTKRESLILSEPSTPSA